MLSATICGTRSAAAELLDGALDVGRRQADFPRSTGAIALEPAPSAFRHVAAEGLAEDLGLRAALLSGNPVGLPDEVGGQRGWGRLTHTVTLRFGVRSGQRAGMDTLSLQDAVMVCAAIRITCTFFGSRKSEPGDV